MEEGVSQGCPLSPIFASLVVACLLKPLDRLLLLRARASHQLKNGNPGDDGAGGITHLLGFVDDVSACAFLEDLHQKQHHVPYSLAISINGTFLLIHGIASTLWAFQYVFLIIYF